jgi:hypothetical protein
MARLGWIVMLFVAANCGAAAQLGVNRSTSETTTTAAPPASGAAAGSEPVETGGAGGEHRMLSVPDVIGKTPDEARALVKAAGFTADVELNPGIGCHAGPGDPPSAEGLVDCQKPDPGTPASSYAMIQISVKERQRIDFALRHADLQTVIGLTVEDARKKLKQLGHVGQLTVHVSQTRIPGCKENRVCGVLPWETGMQDEVTLTLSPKLEISAPAP